MESESREAMSYYKDCLVLSSAGWLRKSEVYGVGRSSVLEHSHGSKLVSVFSSKSKEVATKLEMETTHASNNN
jgi:hypothetical protein